MDEWKLPWKGGCRCGATRFAISLPPLLAAACHCTGCQRMTASAFSLSIGVPAEGFAIEAGEPVLGGLNKDQHYFCPSCMSWMFTRPVGIDFLVNVRATMLDEHGWFEPFAEFWTEEKLPWASTGARLSFGKVPAMEEFEGILGRYAAEGKRP
jgi:hypothetical protein